MTHSQTNDASTLAELLKLRRYDDAFRQASRLAEDGSHFAQVQLGWMWHTGTGTPPNADEAEKWYRAASSAESGQAEFLLGTLFRQSTSPSALRAFEVRSKSAHRRYIT